MEHQEGGVNDSDDPMMGAIDGITLQMAIASCCCWLLPAAARSCCN